MSTPYANVTDLEDRLVRTLTAEEKAVCTTLLDDASEIIDRYNEDAEASLKKIVACRMVIRTIGSGSDSMAPVGSTQGSMSALGYAQSWTMGNGSVAELYMSKQAKKKLGAGGRIGAHSPLEGLVSND